MQEAGWTRPEREGKRKGMLQNRVWAGKTTEEEKKSKINVTLKKAVTP